MCKKEWCLTGVLLPDTLPQVQHVEDVGHTFYGGPVGAQAIVRHAHVRQDLVQSAHGGSGISGWQGVLGGMVHHLVGKVSRIE